MPLEDCFSLGQEAWRELDLQNRLQGNPRLPGVIFGGDKYIILNCQFLLASSAYAFTPALRRIVIIGHQFVKADWNRFKPTKAVKRNQYGLTQYPNASEARTKAPAISLR